MESTLDKTLKIVSDATFPESRKIRSQRFWPVSTEIVTSLPLQVMLYFNWQFSVVFFVGEVIAFVWKVNHLDIQNQEQIFTILCLVLWAAAEPGRLFFGYTGNLREKVPQLAAFFLLSIFPQLLIIMYLLFIQHRVPFDYAVNIVMLMFLIPEIIIGNILHKFVFDWEGYLTVKLMIRNQATKFYLSTWYLSDADTIELSNK